MGKVSSKNNKKRAGAKVRMPVRRSATKGRVADPRVAALWDHDLTAAQNVARLGFVGNVNTEARLAAARPARLNTVSAAELFALADGVAPKPAGGSLAPDASGREADYIKPDEVTYLKVRRAP